MLRQEQEKKRRLRLTEGGLGSQVGQRGSLKHLSTGQASLGVFSGIPCSESWPRPGQAPEAVHVHEGGQHAAAWRSCLSLLFFLFGLVGCFFFF